MVDDLFEVETMDYEVTQGDTLNIPLEIKDKNKNPINDIVSQDWDSRFSIEDPISRDIIASLVKTHDDVSPAGDGVYYNGDTYSVPGLAIDADNKVVVVLTNTETAGLKPGIYPFYFKFEIDQAYHSEFTAAKGNIIVKKRDT
jgi:hypothetical protein